ncbi:MAG: sigma 54-interacting transcriptional regulator [Sandaracinaceae bacterium]|nr:sigma 54-interacting transcriptional regulator [Sandaracinaceae bacterium]
MEAILLSCRGEPLGLFPIRDRGLEVGSGLGCDVVVRDASIPERFALVKKRGDTVLATFLDGSGRSIQLSPGKELPIGKHHAIVWRADLDEAGGRWRGMSHTERIPLHEEERPLFLVVGRGPDARRIRLGQRPLTIGSHPNCGLVLYDQSVSAFHCRLEPNTEGSVWIRDLESRNGTWVNGIRSVLCQAGPGARIRVGRTDLFLVTEGGRKEPDALIAASPQMVELLEEVERLAQVNCPVLITGPSGAGKEGIARALHLRGPRARYPFVAINAAAIPPELIESELFGHEKGAFTGALQVHRGVFEQAERGTLFLDEIAVIDPSLQAKLLRVLDHWSIRRVGAESERKVEVRLVCATHRDLRAMVSKGQFRADLYYRLVQIRLHVPPLVERPKDIKALALHFLEQAQMSFGPCVLSQEALDCLLAYDWPGNARELRSVIWKATSSAGGVIQARDIKAAIESIGGPNALADSKTALLRLVEQYGSVSAAARAIGIPRSTLRDRIARARAQTTEPK